ncbi:hypothetical protein A1Q2_02079 [Trichosporon asahii var. asahii CBS 8904]|uniref:Uncharacterized protein n=1 Tax=Trichosporon asahii var. asahii (strain CBS 8904) TaxID=1220162 RepID=K1VVW9_TRIAC|nr:hypothetical protein A1Q2_02079 [Trichosporon asahii var. asahii CBS 8904]
MPHILDEIIANAAPETLRVLRATASWVKRAVDKNQRHFRLTKQDLGLYDSKGDFKDSSDRGVIAQEWRERPPPISRRNSCSLRLRCRATATGALQQGVPLRMDVLDVEALPMRMWQDYVDDGLGIPFAFNRNRFHAPQYSSFGSGNWTEHWAKVNEKWYSVQPRLVRYLDGLGSSDSRYGEHRYKPNLCAVHFCDLKEFDIALSQLTVHAEGFQRDCAPLTAVLNIRLGATCSLVPQRQIPWRTSNIHKREGDLTLLVTADSSYARAVRGTPSLFWNDLLHFIHAPSVLTASQICRDKGSITIVGSDA